MGKYAKNLYSAPVILRRLLLSWLTAVTISYLALPSDLMPLNTLAGIENMSLVATLIMFAIIFCTLCVIGLHYTNHALERWLLTGVFCLLSAVSLIYSFRWSFLIACCMIGFTLVIYAVFGWNSTPIAISEKKNAHPVYAIIVAVMASAFILFVSVWTVARIKSFCTPTYDFGIFSQMFHYMKNTGAPFTTLERDSLLSHFHVHVSPIYYLILPIYCLFPTPETLQIMQAVILGSAAIPMWLLCRKHGLSPLLSTVLCELLLVYPAYSAGSSYDIHENAFLAPLLLWLLYSIDRNNTLLAAIFTCLTLLVKEDAAVYVAVAAVYLLTRGFLKKSDHSHWEKATGTWMLAGSILWFLLVTSYLSKHGDGVMTGRYQNFMYGGSSSLITVIKSVILCPMKALYECIDGEKLEFIHLTLFPIFGFPLITRRYERYLLLIPYILVNLMSDYQYQHDIFFQYTYGSAALLFYLAIKNIADIKIDWLKLAVCIVALLCAVTSFKKTILPVAKSYPAYNKQYSAHYTQIRNTLEQIPDDASVSATTYYTTFLSQRDILYDIKYTSLDHLLSTEYIALAVQDETSYKKYASGKTSGYERLCQILEEEGYVIFAEYGQSLVIYKKP